MSGHAQEAAVAQQGKPAKSWTSPRKKSKAGDRAQPAEPPAADLWEKGKEVVGDPAKEDGVLLGGSEEAGKTLTDNAPGTKAKNSFAASRKQAKAAGISEKGSETAQEDDAKVERLHSARHKEGTELNGGESAAEAQAVAGQMEANGTLPSWLTGMCIDLCLEVFGGHSIKRWAQRIRFQIYQFLEAKLYFLICYYVLGLALECARVAQRLLL